MTMVLGANVSETSYASATEQIRAWALAGESRAICIANVHVLMESHDSPVYRQALNQADMITPDGMPLVWMLRLKGVRGQTRVYGPTLMLHVLKMAANEYIPVGFYGAEETTLERLAARLLERLSTLKMVYAFSPPFRALDTWETAKIAAEIAASGVRILFVGLGCPKQELWMAAHQGKIPAVMLGVGAGFDFHAGVKRQSPPWLQRLGLEWLFRLIQEPRRLWRRYLYNNPRFVFLSILDLLGLYR